MESTISTTIYILRNNQENTSGFQKNQIKQFYGTREGNALSKRNMILRSYNIPQKFIYNNSNNSCEIIIICIRNPVLKNNF